MSNSTSGGGHAYSATAGNDTQYDPSWINSNNVFCYNSASGGTIPKFWDQRGTNNVYVGNSIGVENVGSFGYEEKGGTDPRCDIPAKYAIPAVPAKPAAMGPIKSSWLSWLPHFKVEAAAISATITAAPNPCIPLNGADKCNSKITWSSTGAPNLKISIREVPGSLFAQGASGSQDAPWIATSGATFDAYNGTTLLGSVKVTAVTSTASASQAPGASASASASASQAPSGPSSYRLAEAQEKLAQAEWIPYTTSPILTNFTISKEPGPKQIWVEFKNAAGQSITDHLPSFDLLSPAPTVSGVTCTLDISNKNLKVTISGTNLGSQKGTLTANTSPLEVVSWDDTTVVGLLKTAAETGQKYSVVLKRLDSLQSLPQSCQVNTSAVSLGARVFCRSEGQFDVSNVKISFAPVDAPDKKIEEVAVIDKDGIAQGLKTKLQANQQYLVSITAPYSIRRNAVITVQEGTTVINAPDGKPFILPIGDIAPSTGDGEINALDRSELVKQWKTLDSSKSGTLTADFNRDKKVNSIDWACMKYDFNAKNDDPTSTGSTYSRGVNFSNGQNSAIFTSQ